MYKGTKRERPPQCPGNEGEGHFHWARPGREVSQRREHVSRPWDSRIWTGLEGEGEHPREAKWYRGGKNTGVF